MISQNPMFRFKNMVLKVMHGWFHLNKKMMQRVRFLTFLRSLEKDSMHHHHHFNIIDLKKQGQEQQIHISRKQRFDFF